MTQALGFLVHPLRMAIKHAIPAVVDEARAHVLHQQATIVEWRAARKPPLPPPFCLRPITCLSEMALAEFAGGGGTKASEPFASSVGRMRDA